MSTSSFIADYHISFYIGGRVFSHKVTGTIGGAYMHMDVLIERAEQMVDREPTVCGLLAAADDTCARKLEGARWRAQRSAHALEQRLCQAARD